MTGLVFLFLSVVGAPPSAMQLIEKYDEVMGPTHFEAKSMMIAHREDDSERTYKMKILKSDDDKMRIWFDEPASVRGQEILRQGENMWVYMPNLKRAVRMASRESFQGGDFNNGDILRVNYKRDYDGVVAESNDIADTWLLELKAKSTDAAYDKIKLWLRKKDLLPVKGEYYTESGKMLRQAEFSDVKNFGGLKRPAKILMRNMLAQKRFSIFVTESFNIQVKPAATLFVLDNLGR